MKKNPDYERNLLPVCQVISAKATYTVTPKKQSRQRIFVEYLALLEPLYQKTCHV